MLKRNKLVRHEKVLMHISERSKFGRAFYFTTLLIRHSGNGKIMETKNIIVWQRLGKRSE